MIFDVLVPISRYSNYSPSAVQELFEFHLANRDFWPYVFTVCNLCALGLLACLLRDTHLLMRWPPTSHETSFLGGGGGFNTFIDVRLFVTCFALDVCS